MGFSVHKGFERFESLRTYIGLRENTYTKNEYLSTFYTYNLSSYMYTLNILNKKNLINIKEIPQSIFLFKPKSIDEQRYINRMFYSKTDIDKFSSVMYDNARFILNKFTIKNNPNNTFETYSSDPNSNDHLKLMSTLANNLKIKYLISNNNLNLMLSNIDKYDLKLYGYHTINTRNKSLARYTNIGLEIIKDNAKGPELFSDTGLKLRDLIHFNDWKNNNTSLSSFYTLDKYMTKFPSIDDIKILPKQRLTPAYTPIQMNFQQYGFDHLNNGYYHRVRYYDSQVAFTYYIKRKLFPAFMNSGKPIDHWDTSNSFSGIDLMRVCRYSNMYKAKNDTMTTTHLIPANAIIEKSEINKMFTILYGYDVNSNDKDYDIFTPFVNELPQQIDLSSIEFNDKLEKWYYKNVIDERAKYSETKKYTYYKTIMIEEIEKLAILARGEVSIKLTPVDSVGDLNLRPIDLLNDYHSRNDLAAYNLRNTGLYNWNYIKAIPTKENNQATTYYRFANTYHDIQVKGNPEYGINSRCFKAEITSAEPVLFLGGCQVLSIDGPFPQFTEAYVEEIRNIVKLKAWDSMLDRYYDINKLSVGSLIHQLFAIHQPHEFINFCFDFDGSILKFNREFYKPIKENIDYDEFTKFLSYNVQHQPRKNPYIYLTKVNCWAANIAENFNSLTDEMTFIGPMVDNRDVFINTDKYAPFDTLMPHVNYGAKGMQAEVRHIQNMLQTQIPDNKFKWNHMSHNRWYVVPHRHTRLEYDMINAHFVGTDIGSLINNSTYFFRTFNSMQDYVNMYLERYHKMKYHIMAPEYAFTQRSLIIDIENLQVDSDMLTISFPYAANIFTNITISVLNDDSKSTTYPADNIETFTPDFHNGENGISFRMTLKFSDNHFSTQKQLFDIRVNGKEINDYITGLTGVFPNNIHETSVNKFLSSKNIEVIGDRLLENLHFTYKIAIVNDKLKTLPVTFFQSTAITYFDLSKMSTLEVFPDYALSHVDTYYKSTSNLENNYYTIILPDHTLSYFVDPFGYNSETVFVFTGPEESCCITNKHWYGSKSIFYNYQEYPELYLAVQTKPSIYSRINSLYTNNLKYNVNKFFLLPSIDPRNDEEFKVRYPLKSLLVGKMFIQNGILASGASYDYFNANIHGKTKADDIKIRKPVSTNFDTYKYIYWLPNHYIPLRKWQIDLLWIYNRFKDPKYKHIADTITGLTIGSNKYPLDIDMYLHVGKTVHECQRYGLDSTTPMNIANIDNFIAFITKHKYSNDIYTTYFRFLENSTDNEHSVFNLNTSQYSPTTYINNEFNTDYSVKDINMNIGNKVPRELIIRYLNAGWILENMKDPNSNYYTIEYNKHLDKNLYNIFDLNKDSSNNIINLSIDEFALDYFKFMKKIYYKPHTYNLVSWLNTGVYTEIMTKSKVSLVMFKNDNPYFADDNNVSDVISMQNGNILWNVIDQVKATDIEMSYKLTDFYTKLKYLDKNNYHHDDKLQIFYTREENSYTNKFGLNYVRTDLKKLPSSVAERGEQYIDYNYMKHFHNLLMVYDYQKLYESSFFERTDTSFEYYGVNDKDRYTEIMRYPYLHTLSRRDTSGMITGMLLPPVLYTAGSMMSVNIDSRSLVYNDYNTFKLYVESGYSDDSIGLVGLLLPFLQIGAMTNDVFLYSLYNTHNHIYNSKMSIYEAMVKNPKEFFKVINKFLTNNNSNCKTEILTNDYAYNNKTIYGYNTDISNAINIISTEEYLQLYGILEPAELRINIPTSYIRYGSLSDDMTINDSDISNVMSFNDMNYFAKHYTDFYNAFQHFEDNHYWKFKPNLNSLKIDSGALFGNYKLQTNIISPTIVAYNKNTINEAYPHYVGNTFNTLLERNVLLNQFSNSNEAENIYPIIFKKNNNFKQPYKFIFNPVHECHIGHLFDKFYDSRILAINLYANESYKLFKDFNHDTYTKYYKRLEDNYGLINVLPVTSSMPHVNYGHIFNNIRNDLQLITSKSYTNKFNIGILDKDNNIINLDMYSIPNPTTYSIYPENLSTVTNADYLSNISTFNSKRMSELSSSAGYNNTTVSPIYINTFDNLNYINTINRFNGEYSNIYDDWFAHVAFKCLLLRNKTKYDSSINYLKSLDDYEAIRKLKNMVHDGRVFRYKTFYTPLMPYIINGFRASSYNGDVSIANLIPQDKTLHPSYYTELTNFSDSFGMFIGDYQISLIDIYVTMSKYENIATFKGNRLLQSLTMNKYKYNLDTLTFNNKDTITSINSFYRGNYTNGELLSRSTQIAGGVYIYDTNEIKINNIYLTRLENISHMYDIIYNGNTEIDALIKQNLKPSDWRFVFYDYVVAKHLFRIRQNTDGFKNIPDINIFSNFTDQTFKLAQPVINPDDYFDRGDVVNGAFMYTLGATLRSRVSYIKDMFKNIKDNSPNDNDKLKHVSTEYVLFGHNNSSSPHSLMLNSDMARINPHTRKPFILEDGTLVSSLQPSIINLHKYSELTGLKLSSTNRTINIDNLEITNYYKFEEVPNGRKLKSCMFEVIPIVESNITYHVESIKIRIGNELLFQAKDTTIEYINKHCIFTLDENYEESSVEFEISSNVYNWVIRVIPEIDNQNNIKEPVVTISLPFVSTAPENFTIQALTRRNHYLAKYDTDEFIETYKADGDNLSNIVPLILIFGRIKQIPTTIFEQIRSTKTDSKGISLYSTLAGSHVKSKWDIGILAPIRKVADLYGITIHGIGAWMFRLLNNQENDFRLTNENSWINTGVQGEAAITGDFYEFLYGTDNIEYWTVIDSIGDNEELKNELMNDDDKLEEYVTNKMISNHKDHIIPLLFANCGNSNGFTVSNTLFKRYYQWCLERDLSDCKIMFIGLFAGSYITSVTQYLNGVDINTKIKYSDISNMPVWSASDMNIGCILWDHNISSMTTHGNLLNPDITKRPHLVFMGYLPNDFTYAFCPLLTINTDIILESYTGVDKLDPADKINPHFINHRGQFINCKVDGILSVSRLLETYSNGTDIHVLQLSFSQFVLKRAFYSMVSRLDSSLNNPYIQQYANKIIDLCKYIKYDYIEESMFRFDWFNSTSNNKFKVYADYLFFGRTKLIDIRNTGKEYMDPYSSYRRCFMDCINLKQIPNNLIPVEHILRPFKENILGFIEMFNGSKAYIPLGFVRNPDKIPTGYILNTNVTHTFKNCYFMVECDPKTMQPIEDLNGLDIKLFGHIEEVTTPTINVDKIRNARNIPDVYNIIFKEYIGHPQAVNDRWAPYFHTRLIMYIKVPKQI